MEVNCAGCAGCCVDWRPVSTVPLDHERRGRRRPLDDTYNLVPLTQDEVRGFLDAGLGDVMVPRLWYADGDDGVVTIDRVDLAAVDGRPVFFVGLRKPTKPVAPFGLDRTWLDACVFLDPDSLQCRLHGGSNYPSACRTYPGANLRLDVETECERVESVFGGTRLVDDAPPEGDAGLLLGSHALGSKVFCYPTPEDLTGVVARAVAGKLTTADRAAFVAVAAGSHPGSLAVDGSRAAAAHERTLAADSWAGRVIAAWDALADEQGSPAANAPTGSDVEGSDGVPDTPGW